MKKLLSILLFLAATLSGAHATTDGGKITTRNVSVQTADQRVVAALDIVLDDIQLASNHQLFVTPCIEADGQRACFPTVLVNGRNMHYVYERSGLSKQALSNYDSIKEAVRRQNGKPQSVSYAASITQQDWMNQGDVSFYLVIDSCGCGALEGNGMTDPMVFNFNPIPKVFYLTYITPAVTELPVSIHEGKARVQFEVNRTVLHAEPYVCKSGQRIDNREQLKVIEDSIAYALRDPNVELASINVCGYASPESPYDHNDYLATNRSRALAEYIGMRYNLPADRSTFGSVPENWAEFREQVVAATDITEKQRQDLLELIDRPTYGSSDYDAKERLLKTDRRFAQLYRTKILPVWFPELRCTKFTISTRLKPTSDEKLAEIIKQTPELLSLNQMFRVARLYPEGSAEFNETIATALRFYANDPVANLNAAVAALQAGDYDRAARLLPKAGNSPEAENARGALAGYNGDIDSAIQHFQAAGNLPEAVKNKALLKR